MATVFHPEAAIHSAYGQLTSDEWYGVIDSANKARLFHSDSVTGLECARCDHMDKLAREIVDARTVRCDDGKHSSAPGFYGTNEATGPCSRCGITVCGRRVDDHAFCTRADGHGGNHRNDHPVAARRHSR